MLRALPVGQKASVEALLSWMARARNRSTSSSDLYGDFDDAAEEVSEALLCDSRSKPGELQTKLPSTAQPSIGKPSADCADCTPVEAGRSVAWLKRLPKACEADLPVRKRRQLQIAR